eukprot:3203904-Prymnesium_polylepis.1
MHRQVPSSVNGWEGASLVRHHGGHRCAPVGRRRQGAEHTRGVTRVGELPVERLGVLDGAVGDAR